MAKHGPEQYRVRGSYLNRTDVSPAEIARHVGFSRELLASWGVPWLRKPSGTGGPPAGWRRRLECNYRRLHNLPDPLPRLYSPTDPASRVHSRFANKTWCCPNWHTLKDSEGHPTSKLQYRPVLDAAGQPARRGNGTVRMTWVCRACLDPHASPSAPRVLREPVRT